MSVDPVSIGIKVGLTALSMGLQMMNKIEGPRLDSLDVTTADFGTPLDYFWGKKRLEGCPIFWAEKLREKKSTSKTKGGKYSQYKYFGTFGVIIADHAIDSVSRIWMDKHLVYDVTKPGPISALGGIFSGLGNAPVKLTRGRNMRIYDGTQVAPDPRMEAWCEDRYGADSCPAYKDVSYIVFEDLPLEKFGNRIPQITVEAISAEIGNPIYEARASSQSNSSLFYMSPLGGRMAYFDGDIEWWDTANRQKVGTSDMLYTFGGVSNVAMDESGSLWYIGQVVSGVDIASALIEVPFAGVARVVVDLGVVDITSNQFSKHFWYGGLLTAQASGGYYFNDLFHDDPASFRDFFVHDDGELWAITQPIGSSADFSIVPVNGGSGFTVTGLVTRSAVSEATALHVAEYGHFFVVSDGKYYIIDDETGAILSSGNKTWSRDPDPAFSPNSVSWFGESNEEFSLEDGSSLRTVTLDGPPDTFAWVYDPVTHAIIARPQFEGNLYWSYIDRITGAAVNLSTIIEDTADRCNTTVDVSDVAQTVSGYSVTQGAGKDWIGPLLDIHDVDARPHDFSLQFLTRGDAPAGTIATSEFVREQDEDRYTVTIKQDTDLPRKLSLTFADANKDQQVNTVLAQRPLDAMDSVREQQIDLGTYVATPGEAQKFADRYHRRIWNERETISNALTAQYLGLEPGDVYTVSLDGVERYATAKKVTLSGGRINVEWSRGSASLHTLGTGEGAEMDGRDDDEIFVPDMSKGFILDIPLTEDSHSDASPLLYYGMGSFGGDWPGGAIFEADLDADEYALWNSVESSARTTWGYATDGLGTANPNLWDRGNSVNIRTFGTLTSCTEADIDANPLTNLALLGDELINFTTSTLESDGTYTLSGFKRGRRGTEWARDDHAAGETFCLVANLEPEAIGLSDVGEELDFKAQTLGRDLASAEIIEVDFTGASLKPYAPAWLKWTFDGTDLQGTIRRRTRVGGAWTGGSTIPLSESIFAYEVEIYNGATLKRTIEVTDTSDFTYTAAMAATDGITLPTPPTAIVYQMSDAVGRGFALAA